MCHSLDSRPPAAPHAGAVRDAGALVLTAADGAASAAYQALPAVPNGRNVVILPDVRGVHPYYQDLARRFAEAGFGAVAVDYYGRTAGVGDRGDDFDWSPLLPRLTPGEILLDVRAAAAHLSAVGPGDLYSVGFCFGGGQSWRLATTDLPLAGAIGFYGRPAHLADVADRVHTPLLMLIAGDDEATPRREFTDLDAALTAAGAPHAMHIDEGAPL